MRKKSPNRLLQRFCAVLGATIIMASLFLVFAFRWSNQRFSRRVLHLVSQGGERSLGERNVQKVVLLFWSLYFDSTVLCANQSKTGIHILCDNSRLQNCKVPCEITSDRNRAENATAMIVHTRDPYPLPPAKFNDTPLILFGVENPVYTPVLYDKAFLARFNYLFSYNLELSDFYVPAFDKPSLEPPPLSFSQKTGIVLAVFSHCEKVRTDYMKELMKHIQVDSYGTCLRNKKGLIPRGKPGFKQAKIELARRYKFTLVFTNQDCDYFVDDRLTHALNAGSVPVYMGSDKIDELMVGNLREAFIKVKSFKTPKLLAEYLKSLSQNEAVYNRYLKWKYEGFNFPMKFSTTKHGLAWSRVEEHPYPDYCFICEKFAESERKFPKPRGLLKPDYCKAREMGDWLTKETRDTTQ